MDELTREEQIDRAWAAHNAPKEPLSVHRFAWLKTHYHKQEGRCFYCTVQTILTDRDEPDPIDRALKATVDHVVPLALNGSDTIDDVVMACYRCNQIKESIHPDLFMTWVVKAKKKHTSSRDIQRYLEVKSSTYRQLNPRDIIQIMKRETDAGRNRITFRAIATDDFVYVKRYLRHGKDKYEWSHREQVISESDARSLLKGIFP